MEKEILEKYKKAGRIIAEVMELAKKRVKPGLKIFELAEFIEKKTIELGAKPGFPACISLNGMAAHYSPILNDTIEIGEKDYVKIDIGAHVDGYISDMAETVRIAGKDDIIKCSEKMLAKAMGMFKPGTTIREIGEAVENVAKEFGMNPIRNLTGHSIERHVLHAGMHIPNIKEDNKYQLREWEVYAIEPFCTPGNGFVKDSGSPLIFRWISDRPCRTQEARKIQELAKIEYERLPFAKRWIQKQIPSIKVELALKELLNSEALYAYHPLKEVSEKNVAQTEHTLIVRDKPILITSRK